MLLADLGAEVIKIEPPEGDIARRVSPHQVGGHNAYFASLNRSKKSVVLDLASAAGQIALHGLAARAHALIVNLRPAAVRKLGLTYDALKAVNPALVCVALTGYGLKGGHADRPAYDYVIQALTGVMAITGEPGGPPAKTGYSAVDNSAGMMGALGLLAKIVEGKGGQIDLSMHDVMLSQLNYLAGAWLNAGERAQRMARSAHPYIVPAQVFETQDGWLVVFISHDEFWRRFCNEAGRPDWLEDARFATMAARRENRDTVLAGLAPLFRSDTTASWIARLAPLGVVVAPVETLEQALASDLVREREMVVTIECPGATLRAVGNPIRIDGMPQTYGPPPRLGEHNAELMQQGGAVAGGGGAVTQRDGEIRYLRLRADTLMGMFRHLPAPARAQAFAALVRASAEHGGDSARRYLESGSGDTAALLARIEKTAGEFGWGNWRFSERSAARLALEVADSPFAAGYGAAETEVCAPITGMLQAVAGLVFGAACEAREIECCARGAAHCRFEAILRTKP
jgi:crotonobetainyl-CoA:carnitine CoA-transferase CaiB-like acyl-CoA transferase/predicted hydrocarbon binding protein